MSILIIGQFAPIYTPPAGGIPITWRRDLVEEGTWVEAGLINNCFKLKINPSVAVYLDHAHKRLAAGVYFEIAAKYAEKVNGVAMQQSVVVGCKPTEAQGSVQIEIAHYPTQPLTYERICPGFRELFLTI